MTAKLEQPVILISGGSAGSASVQAAVTMVANAGGVPMVVSNHLGRVRGKDQDGLYAEATRLMQMADGLLVMGNNSDIDPQEYGQQRGKHTKSELSNPDGSLNEEGIARRNLETLLMKIAVSAGMPMFGICGGMQRMNVICGGTLHQHIPEQMADVPHSEHAQQELGIPPFVPVQPVNIARDSFLFDLARGISAVYTPARTLEGDIHLDVNSMHHQAVDKLGMGLRASAFSEDTLKDGSKLVEAIEIDPNGPLATGPLGNKRFGVFTQWHPEFSDNPLGAQIAKQFVTTAKAFSQRMDRRATLEQVRGENNFSSLPMLKLPQEETLLRVGSFSERILNDRAQRDPNFGLAL